MTSDQLTLFAAGSPVSHSRQPHADGGSPSICGPTCSPGSKTSHPDTSSPKTSQDSQSQERQTICGELDTPSQSDVYQGLMRGQTIREIVGGPLHTPTTKANFCAPSMQKWPSCRRYVAAFGGVRITPEQFEFLMGYPIGWTDLNSLETRFSRKSPKSSGGRSSNQRQKTDDS